MKFLQRLFGGSNEPPSPDDRDLDVDLREYERRMAEERTEKIANSLTPGELSKSVNWAKIQSLGKYISPRGSDPLHVVTLTHKQYRSESTVVAEITCTNYIYSEWIMCLCDTQWHTDTVVLEDHRGRLYPMGKMLSLTYSIKYVD